uniref:Uncharacterized protein n=1 Tax=Cacopsylla melanoneura TaxID=428564 RepID=A0A8D8X5L4_9HEMI
MFTERKCGQCAVYTTYMSHNGGSILFLMLNVFVGSVPSILAAFPRCMNNLSLGNDFDLAGSVPFKPFSSWSLFVCTMGLWPRRQEDIQKLCSFSEEFYSC